MGIIDGEKEIIEDLLASRPDTHEYVRERMDMASSFAVLAKDNDVELKRLLSLGPKHDTWKISRVGRTVFGDDDVVKSGSMIVERLKEDGTTYGVMVFDDPAHMYLTLSLFFRTIGEGMMIDDYDQSRKNQEQNEQRKGGEPN